jgi:hypothetical protein
MKFLFWLLLLVNLGLLAYFNVDLIAPREISSVKQEINAEQMKLLTQTEIETMPKRQGGAPIESATPTDVAVVPQAVSNEPVSCYEWGSFSATNLAAVQNILNQLSLKSSIIDHPSSQESTRYWVYKPPLASAEAAEKKADELRALGIEDFFIVKESKWRNAISFGVFRDEQLATNMLDDLRHKGVREIVKSVRNHGSGYSSVAIEGVTASLLTELKKSQPEFPDSEIKQSACPVI